MSASDWILLGRSLRRLLLVLASLNGIRRGRLAVEAVLRPWFRLCAEALSICHPHTLRSVHRVWILPGEVGCRQSICSRGKGKGGFLVGILLEFGKVRSSAVGRIFLCGRLGNLWWFLLEKTGIFSWLELVGSWGPMLCRMRSLYQLERMLLPFYFGILSPLRWQGSVAPIQLNAWLESRVGSGESSCLSRPAAGVGWGEFYQKVYSGLVEPWWVGSCWHERSLPCQACG